MGTELKMWIKTNINFKSIKKDLQAVGSLASPKVQLIRQVNTY